MPSNYQEPIREPQRLWDRIRRKRSAVSEAAIGAAARFDVATNFGDATDSRDEAFDGREIACDSEEAAREEAERRQALETDPAAEWIYLKPEETEQWVARRTQRQPEEDKPPFMASLIAALLSEPPH